MKIISLAVCLVIIFGACTKPCECECLCESGADKKHEKLKVAYNKLKADAVKSNKQCLSRMDHIYLSEDYWERIRKHDQRERELRYELQGVKDHAEMWIEFYSECAESIEYQCTKCVKDKIAEYREIEKECPEHEDREIRALQSVLECVKNQEGEDGWVKK